MPRPLPRNDYSDLERIYREGLGKNRSFGDLQRPPRSPWKRFLMIVFFVLALSSLAAWSGFYIFNSADKDKPSELRFEITAPEVVAAGEPLEYRLALTNVSGAPVSEVNLRLNYPDGFIWKSATLTPESSAHNIWNLGTISPGESKEIITQGMVFGESGGMKMIFGAVTYRLPNFRSELEVSASAASRLDETLFKITVSGPVAAVPGEAVSYEIKYEHNGATELPAGLLTAVFSPNFRISEVAPDPVSNANYQWNIPALLPKSNGLIQVSGAWEGEAAGEETVAARFETKSDTGAWLMVGRGAATTRVSHGAITLSLKVNDNSDPKPASLGDILTYVLEYENLGESAIGEAAIKVEYESALIDWSGVSAEDGGQVNAQSIGWESERVPALVKVLPKSRGFLRWTIPLVKTLPAGALSLEIKSTPTFSYKLIDGQIAEKSFEGAPLVVRVNGPVSLAVEARYFDDASRPVGSGPLPPRVGNVTVYRVTWRVRASRNPLTDVRIKADLPAGVTAAAESISAEKGVGLMSDSGSPEWHIESLAPSLEPTMQFTVALLPRSDDLGKVLALSSRTVLTAIDSVTNGEVTALGNVITTNLEMDLVARGQGVVSE